MAKRHFVDGPPVSLDLRFYEGRPALA